MPLDTRAVLDKLNKMATEVIDRKLDTDALIGCLVGYAGLQCEQLQRIGHTLHQVAGTLDSLLKELRNAPSDPRDRRGTLGHLPGGESPLGR